MMVLSSKSVNDWRFLGKHPAFPSGKSYYEMIRFVGYPGEEVIIKGSDVVSGWEKYRGNIYVVDWRYNSQQVFCDGEILQQIGGILKHWSSSYWLGRKGNGIEDMEPGSFYYDIKKKKLYVWLKDNSDPNNHLIEASVRPCIFYLGKLDYIELSNLKMMHSNSTSFQLGAALGLGGCHNIIIDNVSVTYADYIGIYFSGSNITVTNSKFNWCGNSGMGAKGWGHRIINCETSHNNYRNFFTGWHAGGVKIVPFAHDVVMSGHISTYNKGVGVWFDIGCSNVTIRNSLIHHNEGNGIFYEISEHGVIKNNIVYENKGTGIVIGDGSDNLIANNLVYKNGSGIRISALFLNRGSWGETFGGEEYNYPWVRNNRIWGNIIMDNGIRYDKNAKMPYDMILPPPSSWPAAYNNISDYNLFWKSDGKEIKIATGVLRQGALLYKKVYNLKQWQEKTGNDKHSKIVEPKFVNLEKRDFHPVNGSPAIGLERPDLNIIYDFDGKLRYKKPKGNVKYYTAGPYEYYKNQEAK